MYVVNAKIMVRDAAKMTDHPIADFLVLFSMLTSSPLVAGFGLPYYYNCQRAPSSAEEDGFRFSYTFQSMNIASHIN